MEYFMVAIQCIIAFKVRWSKKVNIIDYLGIFASMCALISVIIYEICRQESIIASIIIFAASYALNHVIIDVILKRDGIKEKINCKSFKLFVRKFLSSIPLIALICIIFK